MTSIWELYGLQTNPFFTSPLLLKGGTLSIDNFIGRKDEVSRISRLIFSKGGSRILVTGDVGVGKTTFVNYARYRAFMKDFFTPIKEIAVQTNWNPNDFVLNTLASIYTTLKLFQNDSDYVSKETYSKLESLFELSPTVKKTTIQASILGIGGSLESGYGEVQERTALLLQEFFTKVIEEIKENTKKEVIIHYNNLELLKEKDLRNVFDNLRDFFQIPNIHFIFVGSLSVYGIINTMRRFSSTLSDSIILGLLNEDEINEIIEKRLDALKISGLNMIKPYDKSALKMLHKLYGGNIREILNSLSTAVMEGIKENPIILDGKIVGIILKKTVEKRYLEKLSDVPKKVLMYALRKMEFTNSEVSVSIGIKPQNVSKYINLLSNKGCIYLRRVEGQRHFYAVNPQLKWFLLEKS